MASTMRLLESFLRWIELGGGVGSGKKNRDKQSEKEAPLPVEVDVYDLDEERRHHQQEVQVLHGESLKDQSQRRGLGRAHDDHQSHNHQPCDVSLPVSPRQAISDPLYTLVSLPTVTGHPRDQSHGRLLDGRQSSLSVPVVPDGSGDAEDFVADHYRE